MVVGGIAAVVIIGGLVFYGMGNTTPSSTTATSTPDATATTNTGQTTTPSPTPGAPVASTNSKSFPTETTIVVSGTVIPNGAFTNYWYEFGKSESLGSRTATQTVGSGNTPIPAPAYITGLTKDTTYFFRLVASNQYGTVMGSQYTFQTTHGVEPPLGSAPGVKTLAATGISKNTASINGEVTPNKGTTQDWFEYGKTPNLGNTTAFVSAGNGSVKIPASASLSGLDPATIYYFRLNAQNEFGTVNGTLLNFKTAGPAAPAAPTVTTTSATKVTTSTSMLRGTVNPNGAETAYWFEYSTDTEFSSVLLKNTPQVSAGAGTNMTSVSADVSGLERSTTYYFRIVAKNNLGTIRGDRNTFETK
ncbi:MAG: hypothetical protein A2675_03340 [Candidatus Yonathbacteria bacterium RIFCSPHIGHO2_01_FULL_51_10]|uniref:Fibronectin type-III domain-containing protein n=1 Tax=Candidatus Yonathbacteria bacterium RIFCSPHIGHO2_01_FULL_51_10 TaxID=1802723 RepID=A0A1G2S8Q0_9BACT|nr:MAG: hypothetical protein A2675_03340 [Candidatus Yonathbacteria bacterium RIFCSPHIGHO2_01_FULL_51_10]